MRRSEAEPPGDAFCDELRALLADYSFSSIGREAQFQLADLLQSRGFAVEREVRVPGYRRTPTDSSQRGKIGRIDLLATRQHLRVGIEIDSWRVPKTKSVLKLLAFADLTHRVVLLNHAPGLWGRRVSLPSAVSHRRSELDLVQHLDVIAPTDSDRVSGRATAWDGNVARVEE